MISIVVTCHGSCPELAGILTAIACQMEYAKIPAAHSGAVVDRLAVGQSGVPREVVVTSDGLFAGDASLIERHQVKLVENQQSGGCGHGTRATGIAAATGDWIVLTNCDNTFSLGWLDRIHREMRKNVGLVSWNCINNLWGFTDLRGVRMERGRIDLSCVAVRSSIAKRVGFPWRHYEGDWDYIDMCRNESNRDGLRVVHIPETHVIHN